MLTKCRECQKEVSFDAKVCPHCGAKKPGESWGARIVAFIIGVIVLIALFQCDGKKEEKENAMQKETASSQEKTNVDLVDISVIKSLAMSSVQFVDSHTDILKELVKKKASLEEYRNKIERPSMSLMGKWPKFNFNYQPYYSCFFYLDTFRLYSEHNFKAKGKKPNPNGKRPMDDPRNFDVYLVLSEELTEQKQECEDALAGKRQEE